MVHSIKIQQVNSFIDTLRKNNSFVLIKFEKTGHKTLESLRNKLKKTDSYLEVVKNSLFQKAINKLATKGTLYAELKKKFFPLKNNTAVLSFAGNWDKGMKTFFQFIQKEKTLDFKCGILDNQSYDAAALTSIAQLPGKDKLMGKIIGSMKSPSTKLTHALKYNMQRFLYILGTKSKVN